VTRERPPSDSGVMEQKFLTVAEVAAILRTSKMTVYLPDLKRGEIPVKLVVEVDAAAFSTPTLERHVHVADWRDGLAFADPELREAVITEAEAEMIRAQRLEAMRAALEQHGYVVTEPPGDDE